MLRYERGTNLTRVALPVKRAFYFRELAERVISLTKEQAQIMRLHNGIFSLTRSDETSTVFTLLFR